MKKQQGVHRDVFECLLAWDWEVVNETALNQLGKVMTPY